MRSGRSSAASSPACGKFSAEPEVRRFQIISNLSHELRSPLHVLQGYINILTENILAQNIPAENVPAQNILAQNISAEDRGAEFCRESLRILDRMRLTAAEMTQTVENLLEYTAALTGTQGVVKETVDVAELIAELEQRFAPAAQRKNISLVWRVQPQLKVIDCDRRRLVSIINNLVHNAIKFTERGEVRVWLRYLRVRHKCLMELEVTDSGIGIDEARLEEAFAAFVQLSSSNSREHRGLGLGLALVRRNAVALGATLEVESRHCAGSRFRVRFPGVPQACSERKFDLA